MHTKNDLKTPWKIRGAFHPLEQSDLTGRGWVFSGSLVSFFKARNGVKRLDGLSVGGSHEKINSQANQRNGAVAKESSSREHHGERKSSDVSRRSSFKGNRKLGCLARGGDLLRDIQDSGQLSTLMQSKYSTFLWFDPFTLQTDPGSPH